MKHWNRRVGVKVLCFVLVPILVALAIAGCIGMAFLWEAEIYTHTQQELEQQWNQRNLEDDSWRMIYPYFDVQTGELFVPEDGNLVTWPTNLRYRLTDGKDTQLATNVPLDGASPQWTMHLVYRIVQEPSWVWEEEGKEPLQGPMHYQLYLLSGDVDISEGDLVLYGAVDPALEVNDDYKLIPLVLELCYRLRYWGYAIIGALLVLALILFINLLATASRRPGSQELFPGRFHKVPSDLMAALTAFVFFTGVEVLVYQNYNYLARSVLGLIWLVVGVYVGLGLVVGAVGRIKQGCLLKNTLIWKTCAFCWGLAKKLAELVKYVFRHLPMVWRSVLVAGGFGLWMLLLWGFAWSRSGLSVVLLMLAPVIMGCIICSAIALRRLQKAGQALAKGDLNHQLDTRGLYGDLKTHGENLNSIASGMALAVDQRLRSERTKAELITNVSHDIKNPLTSIINYAGLIAQEDCGCENHREYSQILTRKGEHLKRLLEDLVEISKATTGNMELELAPCDAGTLLNQLAGEFQERCTAAGLTLLTRQPEESLHIRVDSRRIWRVFENLMQNACKYSLPGSRVYLALERRGESALFFFRNTSREPLDITPEELMERFVRGDSARTTEGNGLGLSIAQSLTQLQGGQMELTIDGDLFKVTLTFPLIQ